MAPVCVLVTVEIDPSRLNEFHKVIKHDALESRKEPGCLGFDVLQLKGSANRFKFYETYKDAESVAFHKETPHYKLWVDFKETGALVSYSAEVHDGLHLSCL